jgi:hypothetical protein
MAADHFAAVREALGGYLSFTIDGPGSYEETLHAVPATGQMLKEPPWE